MELAEALETLSPGTSRTQVSLVGASGFGDVVVATGSGLFYGSTKRDYLVKVADVSATNLEFNAAGDAVVAWSSESVNVILCPPRSAEGIFRAEGWTVRRLGDGALDVRWHPYADDHIVALQSDQLTIWDVVQGTQRRIESSGVGLCFGSANGWGRFGVILLTNDGLQSLCPWGPLRSAVPLKSAKAMRRKVDFLQNSDDYEAATSWLSRVFLEDEYDLLFEDYDDTTVFLTARPVDEDLIPRERTILTTTDSAVAVANCDRDLDDGSSAAVALAYGDGRVDVCLVRDAVIPSFSSPHSGNDQQRVVVLESVLVGSSAPLTELKLRSDVPGLDPASLLYVTSKDVVVLELGWLDALDAALHSSQLADPRAIVDANPTACRHVVADSPKTVVGAAVLDQVPATLLLWFDDAASAAVNITAAKLFLTIDDADDVQVEEDSSEMQLPRLADEIRGKVAGAQRGLGAVPTVWEPTDAKSELTMLEDAREALENDVALPLEDAARCAEALTKLLTAARDAQRAQVGRVTRRALGLARDLDNLADLADACKDRANHLAHRAHDVATAATALQPRFSRADQGHKDAVQGLHQQISQANDSISAIGQRLAAKKDETTTPQKTRDESLTSHLDLCRKTIADQTKLLERVNGDLDALRATLNKEKRSESDLVVVPSSSAASSSSASSDKKMSSFLLRSGTPVVRRTPGGRLSTTTRI